MFEWLSLATTMRLGNTKPSSHITWCPMPRPLCQRGATKGDRRREWDRSSMWVSEGVSTIHMYPSQHVMGRTSWEKGDVVPLGKLFD